MTNKPFSSGPWGLCSYMVNKFTMLTIEDWTSFDKLQVLKSQTLPDKVWGPEESKEEFTSFLY